MPALPAQDEFARAFYGEAIRHLVDARHLHVRGRSAGSITSSMKAAEFAVKAALILEGGVGFYDRLFGSHRPLIDAAGHPLFRRVEALLSVQRPGLPRDVKAMEALAPKPFGAERFTADETNTEYPYLERVPHPAGYEVATLVSPQARFGVADSRRHYGVARELIVGLPAAYPGRLPRRPRVPPAV